MNDETKKKVIAKLKSCFEEISTIMEYDKYTEPPAPPETSQNARRAMLDAKLKAGCLDKQVFDNLRVWAWKAYSYRYKGGDGVEHPLIEDVQSRIGFFTDWQLTEIEGILEG